MDCLDKSYDNKIRFKSASRKKSPLYNRRSVIGRGVTISKEMVISKSNFHEVQRIFLP